jgi:hypothetical protein
MYDPTALLVGKRRIVSIQNTSVAALSPLPHSSIRLAAPPAGCYEHLCL